MDPDQADGEYATYNNNKIYVYAEPLHNKTSVVDALVIVQNASYIDNRLIDVVTNNNFRLIAQSILISIAFILIIIIFIYKLIKKMAEALQHTRLGRCNKGNFIASGNPIFRPLTKEASRMQNSLIQARIIASEEAREDKFLLRHHNAYRNLSKLQLKIEKFSLSQTENHIFTREPTVLLSFPNRQAAWLVL